MSVFGAHQWHDISNQLSDSVSGWSISSFFNCCNGYRQCRGICLLHSAFTTNSCTLLGASTEDEVSTCIRTWRKRLKNWYKDTVFKPPSHGLRWRGVGLLQMTFLPNCCLTVGLFDVKRECIICRRQNFWYKLWALRATHDWPGHVDSVSLLHAVFYKWRVLHLGNITFSRWFKQTLVLQKNIPARFPAKESNHTQCGHDIQPAVSEADPFLCLNDLRWCE